MKKLGFPTHGLRSVKYRNASALSGVTFKSYHATSTKQPITLVSELNIKKAIQCSMTKSIDCNIKRDTRKAPKGIPNLTKCFLPR